MPATSTAAAPLMPQSPYSNPMSQYASHGQYQQTAFHPTAAAAGMAPSPMGGQQPMFYQTPSAAYPAHQPMQPSMPSAPYGGAAAVGTSAGAVAGGAYGYNRAPASPGLGGMGTAGYAMPAAPVSPIASQSYDLSYLTAAAAYGK
eukprot:TRINITY_DN8584_c0_g2_i4.p1 TRINITY_DN8584_c0_g2~~TRINITY_DN8584_c0_g2_i4.p1  ORF type:complete len:170 (-),score=1.29 TRINITY_DN8584_c0_g2_i4:567-1001(-)